MRCGENSVIKVISLFKWQFRAKFIFHIHVVLLFLKNHSFLLKLMGLDGLSLVSRLV